MVLGMQSITCLVKFWFPRLFLTCLSMVSKVLYNSTLVIVRKGRIERVVIILTVVLYELVFGRTSLCASIDRFCR